MLDLFLALKKIFFLNYELKFSGISSSYWGSVQSQGWELYIFIGFFCTNLCFIVQNCVLLYKIYSFRSKLYKIVQNCVSFEQICILLYKNASKIQNKKFGKILVFLLKKQTWKLQRGQCPLGTYTNYVALWRKSV